MDLFQGNWIFKALVATGSAQTNQFGPVIEVDLYDTSGIDEYYPLRQSMSQGNTIDRRQCLRFSWMRGSRRKRLNILKFRSKISKSSIIKPVKIRCSLPSINFMSFWEKLPGTSTSARAMKKADTLIIRVLAGRAVWARR